MYIFTDIYKLTVDQGKTYLLRLINTAVEDILFFAIANHQLTVVGTNSSYTKPFKTDYITISPGQTIDVLLETNQPPSHYYMAARVYSSAKGVDFDNTTTMALLQYNIGKKSTTLASNPPFPYLPFYNDTKASVNFTGKLRSLANEDHQIHVPVNISSKLILGSLQI
ncbi:hypothetical protein LWI28_028958 [Acer negundo]|uniref:Plastocyanin-like domain-containing protein n=1 Tax=Acer negundo TaxID=4023 RepID=A0AAD5JJN1_ACENE|nr:hypothetical protein LWI28_028958 [Acer negundo]